MSRLAEVVDLGMLKASLLTAMATVAPSAFNFDISTPFFGVPLPVLGMSAAGAIASFSYGDPVTPRLRMYKLALVNTMIGAAAIGIIPKMFGLEWLVPAIEPACAFFASLVARWILPAVIGGIPGWVSMFGNARAGAPPAPQKKSDNEEGN